MDLFLLKHPYGLLDPLMTTRLIHKFKKLTVITPSSKPTLDHHTNPLFNSKAILIALIVMTKMSKLLTSIQDNQEDSVEVAMKEFGQPDSQPEAMISS